MVYTHRRIVRIANESVSHVEALKRSSRGFGTCKDEAHRLCRQSFARPHRGASDRLVVRACVNPLVIVGWMALSTLLLAGFLMPLFSIQSYGLLAILIQLLEQKEEVKESYSLLDVAILIVRQGGLLGGGGIYTLTVIGGCYYIFTMLVAPLSLSAVLMYQWFGKMRDSTRFRLFFLEEVFVAWKSNGVQLLALAFSGW